MRIVLDFDYTLFDTEAMRRAFIDAVEPLGISEQQYRAAEQEAKADGVYSLGEHMQTLEQYTDSEKLNGVVREVMGRAPEFLYPDSVEFLEKNKEEHRTLLTFGNPEWQQRKIEASGIADYLDEIITTDKGKENVLNGWENEEVVFINDRGSEIDVMHEALPAALFIMVRRQGAPYRDEDCELCSFVTDDLSFDIQSLIP